MPAMSADLNLLFGVFALQADFLDAPQFAEACSAWAGRKDTPLADLLVQRGWLSAADRAHVDYLLQCKLEKHHGDVRASRARRPPIIMRCATPWPASQTPTCNDRSPPLILSRRHRRPTWRGLVVRWKPSSMSPRAPPMR
jgi:hypothetical protein